MGNGEQSWEQEVTEAGRDWVGDERTLDELGAISPSRRKALVGLLTSALMIEAQALPQLRDGIRVADDPRLAEIFEEHLTTTEDHERRVRERLAAHAAVGSIAPQFPADGIPAEIFAAGRTDTPERSLVHAFAYEHLEIAAHALLAKCARRSGDGATADMANEIAVEDRRMADRLAASFDLVVDPSPNGEPPREIQARLARLLTIAHAAEREGLHLLESALRIVEDPALKDLFEEHLGESEEHERAVRERLELHAAEAATADDSVLPITGMQVGALFAAHPDAADRLLVFAYPYEHLEIAIHELLARAAQHADDGKVLAISARILDEERAFAEKLFKRWLRDTAAF